MGQEESKLGIYKLRDSVKLRKDLEGYLVYTGKKGYFIINQTGYDILSCCDGGCTFEEIIENLSDKCSLPRNELKKDIEKFVEMNEKLGVLYKK